MPYLDEIVGSDFIIDFNREGVAAMADGALHRHLIKKIEECKILDPRDVDANETTRGEFVNYSNKAIKDYKEKFDLVGYPNTWSQKDISLYIALPCLIQNNVPNPSRRIP